MVKQHVDWVIVANALVLVTIMSLATRQELSKVADLRKQIATLQLENEDLRETIRDFERAALLKR
jgi:cell division protein FtsL